LNLLVLLQIDAHPPKKKGYTRCDDYSHKRCLILIRGSPPMHQMYTTKNARGNAQGYHKANEKLCYNSLFVMKSSKFLVSSDSKGLI
jgi:hypothetical protein